MDGTDNFSTRYMINDACVLLKIPLVYGAISQFEGQLSVFRNEQDDDVNYRDMFPEPPLETDVLNCAEAGVLGTIPGMIGMMMATETIKLITGIGEPLVNQLLIYNALNNQFYQFNISPGDRSRSMIPRNESEFLKTDYEWLCSLPITGEEIDTQSFNDFIARGNVDIVDVRELYELPETDEFSTIRIPFDQLSEKIELIQSDTVITLCQSGKRSLQAAKFLSSIFGDSKKIYSLRGGILRWKQDQAKQSV
jgi:sulfur-carrier protein adenylyltransferase/sulfurtransferase